MVVQKQTNLNQLWLGNVFIKLSTEKDIQKQTKNTHTQMENI